MEHQNAIETLATERYVLGEMNEDELNEFEEHYFGCRECADAVRNGTTFFDSGKVVVHEVLPVPRTWIPRWVPNVAAAMVTMAIGYLLPHAQQVAPMVAEVNFDELSSDSRAGTTEKVVVLRHRAFTMLGFEILADTPYPAYRWELLDESGKQLAAHDVSAEQAKDRIYVPLTSSLPAGQYVLVVEGVREDGNRSEITRFPF